MHASLLYAAPAHWKPGAEQFLHLFRMVSWLRHGELEIQPGTSAG